MVRMVAMMRSSPIPSSTGLIHRSVKNVRSQGSRVNCRDSCRYLANQKALPCTNNQMTSVIPATFAVDPGIWITPKNMNSCEIAAAASRIARFRTLLSFLSRVSALARVSPSEFTCATVPSIV